MNVLPFGARVVFDTLQYTRYTYAAAGALQAFIAVLVEDWAAAGGVAGARARATGPPAAVAAVTAAAAVAAQVAAAVVAVQAAAAAAQAATMAAAGLA